jgi:hypothetical protein
MHNNEHFVPETYAAWMGEVQDALRSINMQIDDWQKLWPFDFQKEYGGGISAPDAAKNANRFWWHRQNKPAS